MVLLLSLLFLSQQVQLIGCLYWPYREFSRQFGSGRQTFHITTALHRSTANPVGASHRLGKTLVLQQGADHPHRKSVPGPHRIDHGLDRHAGDKPLIQMGAVIRTLRPELDRYGFRTLIEIKRRDIRRVLKPGQQATFAQPRQHPVGEGGETVDLADHLPFAGPQARAQVRVERHAAPGVAHARHQCMGHFPRRRGQRRRNTGGVQVPGA